MRFGTKLRLKKDWHDTLVRVPKGEILTVVNYHTRYGLTLAHPDFVNTLSFNYCMWDKERRIKEYFEEVKENCGTCEYKAGNICVNMNNTLMNCDESINIDNEFCCSRYSEKQDD